MALLRYQADEAANIAAAATEAKRVAAMGAAIARRDAADGFADFSNVDNTSDADKPVSTATQTALNAKATLVAAPALASSSGTAGQIAYDTSYFYVCVSANVWRRVAIAVW